MFNTDDILMENSIKINNKNLSYTDQGKGQAVVLLHGYLETKEVWQGFAQLLAKQYRVVAIDLPGHGNSDFMDEVQQMDLMAQAINELLMHLEISSCTLVGHSMGGYAMLAFADRHPHKANGIVLFHSSVYADTDEKRKNRLREIEFIDNGKLELIVNTNLPNTFATCNLTHFATEIEELKARAKKHDPKGVSAVLRGMMARPDRQEMIKNFSKPMLFIFGKKDNYIPIEAAEKMLQLNPAIQVLWLENSGHMGFVEEPESSGQAINLFLNSMD